MKCRGFYRKIPSIIAIVVSFEINNGCWIMTMLSKFLVILYSFYCSMSYTFL